MQAASPDLLVTNYSMLKYMLLRPLERYIFSQARSYFEAHSDEKFFVILDEAHLYSGANGTEVGYLIRRLLDRLGLPASRVVFTATSASFSNPGAAAVFIGALTGIHATAVTTLTGNKRALEPAGPGRPRTCRGAPDSPAWRAPFVVGDRTLRYSCSAGEALARRGGVARPAKADRQRPRPCHRAHRRSRYQRRAH